MLKTSLSKEAEEELRRAARRAGHGLAGQHSTGAASCGRARGARPVEAPDLPGLFEVPYTTAKGTCSASRAHAISSQQSRRLSHVARSALAASSHTGRRQPARSRCAGRRPSSGTFPRSSDRAPRRRPSTLRRASPAAAPHSSSLSGSSSEYRPGACSSSQRPTAWFEDA